jgi:HD superfamily phosphohydrolase
VPNEQNVPFTPRVRALVDSAEFQRLREISQLGLVSRVYPGARHSRFEHALGVYDNALRFIGQLRNDERFRRLVDPHAAEVLIVAALLHDLGHWPFCHPIEDLGARMPPHEAFGTLSQPGRNCIRCCRTRGFADDSRTARLAQHGACRRRTH